MKNKNTIAQVIDQIVKGEIEPDYNWVVIGWVCLLICFFIPFPYKVLPMMLAFVSFFRVYDIKTLLSN